MAQEKTVRATFTGGMRFEAQTEAGHRVVMDSSEVPGGTDSALTPMDLVLTALAGCTGMDVIAILRKMRQDVTGYETRVHGFRQEEHPRVYTAITVEHIVTGRDLNPDLVRRAVDLSATRYCPVGAMLGKAATITHEIRLIVAAEVDGE